MNDRGYSSVKNGKPWPLQVRQGGINGELERVFKMPASKHIKLTTTIPGIPSSDGMVSKVIVVDKENMRQLLNVVADSGLEEVANDIWDVFNTDETRKRPRVWEDG
jgi:hypothetical protein